MSLLPWVFWRALQMHHKPQWRRISAHYVVLLICIYLLFCLGQAAIMARVWMDLRKPLQGMTLASGAPITLTVNVTMLEAVLPALIRPWSAHEHGTVTNPVTNPGLPATAPFPSPQSVLPGYRPGLWGPDVDLPSSMGVWHRARQGGWYYLKARRNETGLSRFANDLFRATMIAGFPVLCLLFSTLAFALLPQSRRQAKVRWAHILRIAAYGIGLCLLPLWIHLLKRQWEMFEFGASQEPADWLFPICFALWPVFLVVWWASAAQRYLRMRHPWGIGLAVVMLGVLMSMACGYLALAAEMSV